MMPRSMSWPTVPRRLMASSWGGDRGRAVFVDRAQVGPGFHLDHGEILAVVEVEIALVLEVGALDGDRFLVVERGAVDEDTGARSLRRRSSCRTSRCCRSARRRRHWRA